MKKWILLLSLMFGVQATAGVQKCARVYQKKPIVKRETTLQLPQDLSIALEPYFQAGYYVMGFEKSAWIEGTYFVDLYHPLPPSEPGFERERHGRGLSKRALIRVGSE